MSHEVEQMFFVGQTPWHGLGNPLQQAPTIEDAIRQAGLDWEVEKRKIFLDNGNQVPGHALVRNTDQSILGVVGPRYEPLQNRDAFKWFQPFLDSGMVTLETGGSLKDGKKVWALARISGEDMDIGFGDTVRRYILLSNSHDGTQSIRVGFTPIRVVCANTMAYAHNSKSSQLIRVRHTANAVEIMNEVRETMNIINQSFEASADKYRFLASKSINETDLKNYIKIVLGHGATKDEELSTRTSNLIADVVNIFHNGRGMDLQSAKGTYWGAYNAASEYFSHHTGRSADSRYNSLWFGTNAQRNALALETAVEMAQAA